MILGVDEVGRGPWAGPLVIGAVVLGGAYVEGLTDSKKLSKKKRNQLDVEIREKASAVSLGWVSAQQIDEIGLSEALKLATRLAVEQIKVPYQEIIIDGTVNFLAGTTKEKYVTCLKKADLLVPCVSAASIIAKVARDKFMSEQDKIHKGYNFSKHVGYGTTEHRESINKHGVTNLHRLSFAPLKKYAQKSITTKSIGDNAEKVAEKHLKNLGHDILDRNWKTKFCEIDIVSQLGDTIFFNEVKYRKKAGRGIGGYYTQKASSNEVRFRIICVIKKNKRYEFTVSCCFSVW
jgi:ribonuclease HII